MIVSDTLKQIIPGTYTSIIILIVGVVSIATSAIGISAYSADKDLKDKHPMNDAFLVTALVISILFVLYSFVGFYNMYSPID